MRKIEQQTINAIYNAVRHGKQWSAGNMSVKADYLPTGTEARVYLHGNHIATITDKSGRTTVALSDAGWQTVTTKSRLNAIAREFGVMGVYQRAHVWYFDNGRDFENWREQAA